MVLFYEYTTKYSSTLVLIHLQMVFKFVTLPSAIMNMSVHVLMHTCKVSIGKIPSGMKLRQQDLFESPPLFFVSDYVSCMNFLLNVNMNHLSFFSPYITHMDPHS